MDVIAFVLAVIAVVLFIVDSRAVSPRPLQSLGLALLAAAWIVQTVWVTTSLVQIGK